jgi:hypothetical protein
MKERYLIDYVNPNAGIGHSLGLINQALKISIRNNLCLAFSSSQLYKKDTSNESSYLKKIYRTLRGKKQYPTHNLDDDLNKLFGFHLHLLDRALIEKKIKDKKLELALITPKELPIPSNNQIDDMAYISIDNLISNTKKNKTVFQLTHRDYGDYEYESTKHWFINSYKNARITYPIHLMYDKKALNVAVHIRRGDLLPGNQFSDLSDRMLPDKWYLDIINTVIKFSQKRVAIYIFSEGKEKRYLSENGKFINWASDYFPNNTCDIFELIDHSFTDTFHHMLNADILIGSKSGMTHLAGMLGNQIKLVPKMWHSYRGADKILELDASVPVNQDIINKFLLKLLPD